MGSLILLISLESMDPLCHSFVQQTTSRFSHYIWFSFFTFSMLLTTFLKAQGNAHSWPLQWAFGNKYWCSLAFRLLGGSCHEIFASLMVSSLCSLPDSSVRVTNIVTKQSLESLVIERKIPSKVNVFMLNRRQFVVLSELFAMTSSWLKQ